MEKSKSIGKWLASFGIAAFCFGYFASYIPYAMGVKMISKGLFAGMNGTGFSGFEIAPATAIASFVSMYLYITFARWWKFATHSKVFGISVPRPQWFTFISGMCTAGIIITTTLSYAFSGISIVFAMLLMRGGVLILAPMVDLIARKRKRNIYWPSWVASILSLGALIVAFMEKAGTALTVVAAIDIGIYMLSYFIRFIFMSNKAKSPDEAEKKRFFVEEQMVANPFLLVFLLVVGFIGSGMAPDSLPHKIWDGFTTFTASGYFFYAFMIGVFSYGTGLFGSLILLDKREHTFCVPANRCSSIVAGVVASYLLAIFYGQRYPSINEMIGVVMILFAIVFLSYRSVMDRKKVRAGAKAEKEASCKLKCCAEG